MLETGIYISLSLCWVIEPSPSPERPVVAQKSPRGYYHMGVDKRDWKRSGLDWLADPVVPRTALSPSQDKISLS